MKIEGGLLHPDVELLRSIRTFPALVKYLRDKLDWPIESEDFDDLTFDYEPEELGIDTKTAVKIKEIKQIRTHFKETWVPEDVKATWMELS